MKLAIAAQMKEMDRCAIEDEKVPSLFLMERAAGHVAEAAWSYMKDGGSAAVFCGSGNNGGDGVSAAEQLLRRGGKVRVFLTGSREKMTADTAAMEKRLTAAGGAIELFEAESEDILSYCAGCSVIIDAMFGTGLNSPLRGKGLAAVELINSLPVPVVAADIPSGVETDSGKVLGNAVQADVTVTFSYAKPGLAAEPGCVYAGEVKVCDIGIPEKVSSALETNIFLAEKEDVQRFLPKRRRISHKSDYGKVLIIAGSVGYTGAAYLAAAGAVRSGAGLVFLGVPEEIYAIEAVKCNEAMPFPLPSKDGKLSAEALPLILEKLKDCDVCLVGPGLGRSEKLTELVQTLVSCCEVPLVLDADGINALSENIDVLTTAKCPVVLTPHEGEFRRLGGDTGEGRIAAASSFAKKYGVTLVLKGHRSTTAFPDGEVWINSCGNAGMARGGSGDVLAGVLAALLGQTELKAAVPAAVWLHSAAGDAAAEKYSMHAMTPTDMLNCLPEVFKAVE